MDKESKSIDSNTPPQKPSLKLALYGGAGIGLLFGIIMGTSTTPTVATVLGALTTLLAGILGLNDQYFNNVKAVRIGSFGFACVIGAYTGLYVRSHNLLSPSPESMKAQYLRLGHSEEQALKLVTFKEFGFFQIPSAAIIEHAPAQGGSQDEAASASTSTSTSTSKSKSSATATPIIVSQHVSQQATQQHSSLLFGAEVDLSGCEELADTDTSLPLDEILNNFELTGGVWETFSISVTENIDAPHQTELLFTAKNAICAESNENTLQMGCDAFSVERLSTKDYESLLAHYSAKPGAWSEIALSIGQAAWPNEQKSKAFILIKESFCDSDETH